MTGAARAGRCSSRPTARVCIRLVEDYIAACGEAGLPYNPDFNGAEQEGAGIYQMTIKSAPAQLGRAGLSAAGDEAGEPVGDHRAQVTRVLIEGGRAVGVEYRQGGRDAGPAGARPR